jgi:Rps23 Pro-64 3,4-dihydroxylase Tpa1-like proline 4-hydroxylase
LKNESLLLTEKSQDLIMKLSEIINENWLDAESMASTYKAASPFPHIVMNNFIKEELLEKVLDEFPDLSKENELVKSFNDTNQIKLAGKGMGILSPSAFYLTSYLNSDLFLHYLNTLTGISEPLISDPYLAGGGYHEIKTGGLLKVHADFNNHPKLKLDRRLNLLIYLNKNWSDEWGGQLQLFDTDRKKAIASIMPRFNTAVLFTTTSFTFHGHPDPLKCPEEKSRKSLAYYYFSTGRPTGEALSYQHSTIFRARADEKSEVKMKFSDHLYDIFPEFLIRLLKKKKKKVFEK